jgi:hypothetical protein
LGLGTWGLEELRDDIPGQGLVLGAGAFHQCDGLAEHDAVAGTDALHKKVDGRECSAHGAKLGEAVSISENSGFLKTCTALKSGNRFLHEYLTKIYFVDFKRFNC